MRLSIELALLAAAVVFGLLWARAIQSEAPVGVAVVATQAPAVADVPKQLVECAKLEVFAPAAKARSNLPQTVRKDPAKAVVSSSLVKADLRPHVVTVTADTTTGEVVAYDTRLPLPWVATDTRGEAGILYGYRGGNPTLRFEARQALADVKAIKVGVIASYDQPINGGSGASFIGVGGWYRW